MAPARSAALFAAHQTVLIDAARAYARLRQWQAFTRAVDRVDDEPTGLLLASLRDLYGLGLIERDLAWYLVRGRLGAQRARAVPAVIDALLAELRPSAVEITGAFGYEQGHLRAAISSGAEQRRQDDARAARAG
jgi:acyl-CoA oxidase